MNFRHLILTGAIALPTALVMPASPSAARLESAEMQGIEQQAEPARIAEVPPAPWADADPADSLYRAGREARNREDFRRAAALFAEISRRFPKSEYAAVIPRFVTAGLAGEGVTIFGDGTQSRDFCYIDNTVAANLAAAAAPAASASGRVFNVACGAATTLNDVVRMISENLGRPIPITYAPSRVGDVKHSLADIAAARAGLGWEAAISFKEGLDRTIAWYAGRRG